jgi:hypothetical protein
MIRASINLHQMDFYEARWIAGSSSAKTRVALLPGNDETYGHVTSGGIARELLFLVLVFVLAVVFLFFVDLFLLISFDFGKLQNGQGQRFAEQVAFSAHPQARDGIVVDFHHRNRMTAGFQDDNIAWFQIHGLFLRVD